MEQTTSATLKSLAVTTIRSVRQPVATLSGGQRQSVAVAKAVQWNSKLVILDEPTAALGVAQTEQVLALVRRLGEQGLAVILISHNLHDVFETADRITVLRLGRTVGLFDRRTTTQQAVVEAITAGTPTKVSGIAHVDGGAGVTTVDVVGPDRAPPPPEEEQLPGGIAGLYQRGVAQPAHGQPRPVPDHRRRDRRRPHLRADGDELLHGGQLRQPDHPDGRDGDARLRRRLRPAARRDRPLDRLSGRHRSVDRRRAPVAGIELAHERHPRHADRDPGVRSDRRRAGLDRGVRRRPLVRGHARRLPDLAGRDPEQARAARDDHHPGPLDQLHRRLHLLLISPAI